MVDVDNKNGEILCTFPFGYEVEVQDKYFSVECNLSVRMIALSAYDEYKFIYTITFLAPVGTKVSIERTFSSIDQLFDWLHSIKLRDLFLSVFEHDLNNINAGERLRLAVHVCYELDNKLKNLRSKIEEIRTANFTKPA